MEATPLIPAAKGESEPWGYQLIVDCFGCDEAVCCDLDQGYEFLDKICLHLKMTKQTQPYIFKTCETSFPGRPGYSGWVPIIESGIQVHTSAKNQFISVDVYSCKRFDPSQVEDFVREWFQPGFVETTLLERGRNIARRRVVRKRVEEQVGAAS